MAQGSCWSRTFGHRTSRRGALRAAGVVGAGLTTAALVGCGDDDDDAPEDPAAGTPDAPDTTPAPADGDGRSGGRLEWFFATGQGRFNPIEASAEGRSLSGRHVYDRLVTPRLEEPLYVLEAAEDVEVVDETTIVFTLRDGLVYQDKPPVDGRPVRTEDIANVQVYARESTLANNGFQVGSLDYTEQPDDRTIIFHLRRPNAYLFTGQGIGHADTMAIIPTELLDNLDETPPVGSGPYQLDDFQMDTSYLYARNPTFREAENGLPYIDERLVRILPDTAAQEAAFRAQQIHVQFIPTVDTADRLIADLGDDIDVTEYTVVNAYEWTLNARRTKTDWADEELFEDVRVREAFYRTFNKQTYTDLVDNGRAENCPGTLAVGLRRYLLDWGDTERYWRHDPAEARQLLEAAGWDFGHEYRVTTLPGARNDAGIQIMQQELQDVGIRTRAHVVPNPEWLAAVCEPGRYDFSIAGHPDYDTPLQPLRHHHTDPQQRNNTGNLGDPEVDAMIERSEEILDPDENVEAVKQIQFELLDRYAHRIYINSFLARDLRWNFVRDWEVSAVPVSHIHYQLQAWLDL